MTDKYEIKPGVYVPIEKIDSFRRVARDTIETLMDVEHAHDSNFCHIGDDNIEAVRQSMTELREALELWEVLDE